MRKLKLIATGVVSFLFFLYLTFPFERIALRTFHRYGLNPANLSFNRLPPCLKVGKLPFGAVTLKNLSAYPTLSGFKLNGELCSGKFSVETDRHLKSVKFKIESLKIQNCPIRTAKLKGTVEGNGSLSFKGKNLKGGTGTFFLKGISLSKVNFGLFSFNLLELGSGNFKYKVAGRNYVKVSGELAGSDASVKVKGSVSVNPNRLERSYVNLRVSVKIKSGSLKGKRFNFSLRGNVNSLRIY